MTLTVGCLGNVHVGTLFCLLFFLFFSLREERCAEMPHDYHVIIVNDATSFVSVACSLSWDLE